MEAGCSSSALDTALDAREGCPVEHKDLPPTILCLDPIIFVFSSSPLENSCSVSQTTLLDELDSKLARSCCGEPVVAGADPGGLDDLEPALLSQMPSVMEKDQFG